MPNTPKKPSDDKESSDFESAAHGVSEAIMNLESVVRDWGNSFLIFHEIKRFINCDGRIICMEYPLLEANIIHYTLGVLEAFGIITSAREYGSHESFESDVNKLAEMVNIPSIPDDFGDISDANNRERFFKFMSDFIERLRGNDDFWKLAKEKGIEENWAIDNLFGCGIYAETRGHIEHLKETRFLLSELIKLAEEQEAKLQKDLDDFE